MKCVTAEEERKLKIAVEHGFTTWAEYEAEEERQRKAEEERTRKEAVEKPARGLSPWFQNVGLTAEDAKDVAIACAEEGVSCPISLCMMPEEGQCRRLQARLVPGLRPYMRHILMASRECVASRQEAPLTPGNASVPEWLASVGLDEATVAEAVRVLGLGGC